MQVMSLAFSPDGNLLIAGCGDGHMYIYKLANGKYEYVARNKHHSSWVRYLFFYYHGSLL